MQLRTVTVTYQVVIVVEDDQEDESVFAQCASDFFADCDSGHDYTVIHFEPYEHGKVADWHDRCTPYGDPVNMDTIGELLAEMEQAP